MKTSRNDPFNLSLCIKGLANQLAYMHNDLFDFMYNITERPGRTPYEDPFEDFLQSREYDYRIFKKSTDRDVSQFYRIDLLITKCRQELRSRWGIDEASDLQDDLIWEQAMRYKPRMLRFKKSKNYLKVHSSYPKVLNGFVDCLYMYLCAVTVCTYHIPMGREQQVELCGKYDLKQPQENEASVRILQVWINRINIEMTEYNERMEKTAKLIGFLGNIARG